MMAPLVTTLLVQAAGGRQIGRLMSTVSLPVVIVPILGPVVSGLIISDLSWRWIFYVNVPMCLAGLVLAWRGLPAQPAGTPRAVRRGRPAAAVPRAGRAAVRPGPGQHRRRLRSPRGDHPAGRWRRPARRVRGARAATPAPLIDLRLLRARAFSAASSVLFLAGLSLFGAMLLLPLYFQEVRGDSALAAGLLLVPQGVGSLLPRTLAGQAHRPDRPPAGHGGRDRRGGRGHDPVRAGRPAHQRLLLAAALVVRGAGLGTATIAVMAGAFQGLDRSEVPHASSVTRIVMQVGGSFGAAVLVAVILGGEVADHAGAGAAGLAVAFGQTFWWCLGFTVLALVPALLLAGRAGPGAGGRA